jgi:uncharacterized ParB-like nuclease family protein
MNTRLALLAPVAFAAAAIGAGPCGSTSTKSDTGDVSGAKKDVAQAVFDLRDAISKRDEAKICDSLVTNALAARIKGDGRGSSCSENLKNSIQDVDATDLDVQSVTVTGASATATIKTDLPKGQADPVDTLKFAKDGNGDWRLSGLG